MGGKTCQASTLQIHSSSCMFNGLTVFVVIRSDGNLDLDGVVWDQGARWAVPAANLIPRHPGSVWRIQVRAESGCQERAGSRVGQTVDLCICHSFVSTNSYSCVPRSVPSVL